MKIFLKSSFWLLLLLPIMAFGQAKVATACGQFLEISPSPRAEGMANSFIGVADDIFAIYYNPAGLAMFPRRQVGFSHTILVADIGLEWAAIAMPALGGIVGVSATALNAGSMNETTPYYPEGTGRTFTAGALSVGATYARSLTDRFSVGVNAKYVGEYLANVSANSWAMDIGTYFRTAFHDIRIAMLLGNFGPDMKYIQQSFPLPMTFHFGMAGEAIKNDTHRLTLDIEGSHPNDNLEKFQIGTEYAYKEFAFVRGGYRLQYDSELFSAGAGIRIPLAGVFARADYSFTYMKYLAPVHRVSLCVEY